MTFAMVAGGVPGGYLQEENDRVKRMLAQQEFDTNQRQAGLRDDLLRAQAQHLRMAGSQSAQRLADERNAQLLYYKMLMQPQGPGAMPGPMGNAPQPPQIQPPQMPPAQSIQANPVAGFNGQTPFMGASMPQGASPSPFSGMMPPMGAGLPQGSPAPMGMPQGGSQQPQPGPMGGAPQMPQAPQAMDPYTQAYQAGLEQIKRDFAHVPPSPAAAQAVQMRIQDLQRTITLQREGDVARRQDAILQSRLRSQESLEDYREEQMRLAGRRVEETERSHRSSEDIRRSQSDTREEQTILRFRVSQAENEIRSKANMGTLKPGEADSIAQKWGVSPDQLTRSSQPEQKNPFDIGDRQTFKAGLDTQLKARGVTDPENPQDFKPFTFDFQGKKFNVYKGEDGKTHLDPV